MKFFLVFTFLFLTPEPLNATNAIRVVSHDGDPLYFKDVKDCFDHAEKNFYALHNLIGVVYPGSAGVITNIICHPRKGLDT